MYKDISTQCNIMYNIATFRTFLRFYACPGYQQVPINKIFRNNPASCLKLCHLKCIDVRAVPFEDVTLGGIHSKV